MFHSDNLILNSKNDHFKLNLKEIIQNTHKQQHDESILNFHTWAVA